MSESKTTWKERAKIKTHASFFSGGVNGMAIGAQRAGIETVYNCEINEFNQKLLKQNFPNAEIESDIRKAGPRKADIYSFTSECQDLSIGNPNAIGIYGERSILLFEGIRIVGENRPDYAVFENSDKLLQRGFERMLWELSQIGYDAEWQSLSLRTFGVQQLRRRLYVIAYPHKKRLQSSPIQSIFSKRILQEQFTGISPGWRGRGDIPKPRTLRSINGYPNYVDRIKAIGNMCHPKACQYLFECIKEYESL